MADNHSSFATEVRARLVTQLTADGKVSSPEWVTALRTVPREAFVPSFFHSVDEPGQPTKYLPRRRDAISDQEWLGYVYEDITLVTQLDHRLWADEVTETIPAVPTSSSTLPGLVIWMLEELNVRDGDKVLEIATGTGYSTALLCERLGAENVTSIEYDPEVARRAADALHGLGYRPKLITGDGLDGDPGSAPFDRIIATCSVRAIPAAWFEQAKPGATIGVLLEP